MARILKGIPVVTALNEELVRRSEELKKKGIVPTLAILRVGERKDDIAYESYALKCCDKIGVAIKLFTLSADCLREELLDVIREINVDSNIHGCLMLRPLADKAMEEEASALLSPAKDIDGMTGGALVKVFTGKGDGYPPCTAQACIELLDYYNISLKGKRVTVIGRSLVIGKPVSMMLQGRDATVTMCHTKTVDIPEACRNADIIIACAGKAGMVDKCFVSLGQIVVDVGINTGEDGKLCGDVKYDKVEPIVEALTPVPGGVGAVTTAVLFKHVIEAAEKTV